MWENNAFIVLYNILSTLMVLIVHVELGTVHTVQYGPGVDSASNRNEYQENCLEVKAAGA
jgi:hypothetical protein